MSSFDSYNPEPTKKEFEEMKRAEEYEARSNFFRTYEQLSDEEKKVRILERWKSEQEKSKSKDRKLPGFSGNFFDADFRSGYAMGEAFGKIAGKILNIGADALGRLVANAAEESTRKNAEVIAETRNRQRLFNDHRQALRQLMLSKTIKTMDPVSPVGATLPFDTSENVPETKQEEVEAGDGEEVLSPDAYLENDIITLPQVGVNEDAKERSRVIAAQLDEVARNESARFVGEDPELANANKDFYEKAARMTERGDVDVALRFLDMNLGAGENNVWNDEVRASAVAMGDVKRELTGQSPVDFDDVSYAMSKNAAGLSESGEPEDMVSGSELLAMLDRVNEPGEHGVHALEDVLDYSERILAIRTDMLNRKLNRVIEEGTQVKTMNENEFGAQFWRNQVEEAQRMRDAVYKEIQLKKAALAAEGLSNQEGEQRPALEQSGEVREEGANESRVPQEDVTADAERKAQEAQGLTDIEIEAARKRIDELFAGKNEILTPDTITSEAQTLHSSQEQKEESPYKFPTESKHSVRYEVTNLRPLVDLSPEEFRSRQEEVTAHLRDFSRWFISQNIEEARKNPAMNGARYVGTVAGVLGDNHDSTQLLQKLIYLKTGERVPMFDLGGQNFAEVAKTVLGFDVSEIPNVEMYWNIHQNAK